MSKQQDQQSFPSSTRVANVMELHIENQEHRFHCLENRLANQIAQQRALEDIAGHWN